MPPQCDFLSQFRNCDFGPGLCLPPQNKEATSWQRTLRGGVDVGVCIRVFRCDIGIWRNGAATAGTMRLRPLSGAWLISTISLYLYFEYFELEN